jgi:hypothetical protein
MNEKTRLAPMDINGFTFWDLQKTGSTQPLPEYLWPEKAKAAKAN